VFFHVFALTVSVAAVIIAAFYEEPTLLASGLLAIVGMAVVLFFSLSKGKYMKPSIVLFLSLCLLISALSEIFLDLGQSYAGYLSRAPAYLGVACLILAMLFAYFALRLDKILTGIFMIMFELAVSVVGALAISIMKVPLLDAGIVGAIDNGVINRQMMVGFILSIIASIVVFYYLSNKNVFLVTEETVLEE